MIITNTMFLGAVTQQTVTSEFTATNVNGSFLAGQVMLNTNLPAVINCASLTPGGMVRITQVNIWETHQTGSAIKPDLRLWIVSESYATPSKGSGFYSPTTARKILGYIDVATGDYVTYNDDASAPGFAMAQKKLGVSPLSCKLNSDTRALYCVPVVMGTYTIASGATFTFEFHIEQ